jgi:hypothetical protein
MHSRSESTAARSTPSTRLATPGAAVRAARRTPWVRRRGRLAGVLLTAIFCMPNMAFAHVHRAQAAINTVANFDATSWAPLLKTGPRPAAYVFTNSYCSTCPMAFDALHARIRASGKTVELAAVVMDVAGAQALAHVHHYTGATKVYAFDGFEPEIRQTVDPQWHNITPYVVLIDRKGAVQRVIGPPSAAQLKAWRL